MCDRHDVLESWCADCQHAAVPVREREKPTTAQANGQRRVAVGNLQSANIGNVNSFVVRHSAEHMGGLARLPLSERAAEAFASWRCQRGLAATLSHFIYLESDAVAWVGRITGIRECEDDRMGFDVHLEPDAALAARLTGQPFQVVRSSMYGWVTEDGTLLDRKPAT